jgi:hypothetical protein
MEWLIFGLLFGWNPETLRDNIDYGPTDHVREPAEYSACNAIVQYMVWYDHTYWRRLGAILKQARTLKKQTQAHRILTPAHLSDTYPQSDSHACHEPNSELRSVALIVVCPGIRIPLHVD